MEGSNAQILKMSPKRRVVLSHVWWKQIGSQRVLTYTEPQNQVLISGHCAVRLRRHVNWVVDWRRLYFGTCPMGQNNKNTKITRQNTIKTRQNTKITRQNTRKYNEKYEKSQISQTNIQVRYHCVTILNMGHLLW